MSVDLVPEWTIGDLCLTSYPFGVDADSTVDIGEPEMVVEAVESRMSDGDLARVVRHGNRTYVLEFYIEGPSLAEIAVSEALLRMELRRSGLKLTHDPGDGFSPASVYVVQTAQLTPQRRDDHESHLIRKFTLTLTCSPFARSAEPTAFSVIDAAPETPTTVVVDACNSTAGWSGTSTPPVNGATLAAAAGAVTYQTAAIPNGTVMTLARAGSVDLTATPFVMVEWQMLGSSGWPTNATKSLTLNGAQPINDITMSDGWRLTTFLLGGSPASLSFQMIAADGGSFSVVYKMSVREVRRSNEAFNVSARQVASTIQVGGTERTTASLQVKSSTGGDLKHTLVATWPEKSSGFAPPLRRWRANGNTVVPDASTLSGSREAIGPSAVTFGVPSTSIPPGAYQLVGRLRSVGATGSLNIYWEASTSVQGVLLDGKITGSYDASFPVVSQWEIVPLGTLVLPVIAATAGDLLVGINHAGSTQLEYDELWLLPIGEDCAVSAANVIATRFWCDAPEQGEANPSLRIGNTDDRGNARSPGLATYGKGLHVFRPGGMTVFVASLTDNPVVNGSYVKHWHSNAAD